MFNRENDSKLLRFVDYLSALLRVNTKIIRDLEEYHKVLWISDIPAEPRYCFTRAWGAQEETADDTWIEIKKFSEPACPKVPDSCKDWVNHETLKNPKDLPELYTSITKETEQSNPETGEIFKVQETLALDDYPDVQKNWETYVDRQWLPWMEVYSRYTGVQKVYAALFLIHQELLKLGEQYELVLCFGLLTWQTPTGHRVHRHLVTAKASLEFEPHLGKFAIRPTMDGDQTEVEFDMLDIEHQPQNARSLVEEGRAALRDNLWDRASLDSLLAAVANSLAHDGQGEYYADMIAPSLSQASEKPTVEYAPALILRKRSARGLEYALSKIRGQIEAGCEVPEQFLDLCEYTSQSATPEQTDPGVARPATPAEIYFPLPTNDEQRHIIHTLNRQTGVLVQGPPGTGKSHTIANLICHLLATDQRVLVTAKTPRALQVLHDKLPSEIKPLCISLLGNGPEERESLERSVAGIIVNLDRRVALQTAWQINGLEARIAQNRAARAETDSRIAALRESETYKHTVADGRYVGTAAEIAREVQRKANAFSWFDDTINSQQSLPVSDEEIEHIRDALTDITIEEERELTLFIPDFRTLPDPGVVRLLFDREKAMKEKAICHEERATTPAVCAMVDLQAHQVHTLFDVLSELSREADQIRRKSFPWIAETANDILAGKNKHWNELLKLSADTLEGLRDVAARVDSYDVSINGTDGKEILRSATAILKHFESGGGNGFLFFKPKPVRTHGPLLQSIRVDGSPCTDAQSLKKLIDYFTVQQRLAYLESIWGDKVKQTSERFLLRIAQFEDASQALESAIHLCSIKETADRQFEIVKGVAKPNWEESHQLQEMIANCEAALAAIELNQVNIELADVYRSIASFEAQNGIHPVCQEIGAAFQRRDADGYHRLFNSTKQLGEKAAVVGRKQEAIETLGKAASNLAFQLAHYGRLAEWLQRLKDLKNVWSWARAKSWLEDFLSSDAESLQRHSVRLAEDIRRDLSELASVKAWDFCFSRMQEPHRRHLLAWQQEMKKLGKGTGKHAHTHRKNAQRHLNECRDSVPAWIMPLHRVYETVEAGPGIFDVIIVDEASQCGSEGLPLMFLGKRILVVGDDKQISPEAVGIERGQVQRLMKDYLFDFSHADSFDVESSLFSHGLIRFTNRITLREHFRCMPEIINFSNDLCYRTDPLIPLRQYLPDRLEPLGVVHVSAGYREGDGQRVVNKPEAEALADAVEQCCDDARYQGMTMGVIVLQGEAQAYVIEELLLKRLGAEEMKKRRLICGNPYSFQGDERDVIFLSMVAAPNQRIGALTHAADQRRFNVAASRAQDQMWLFHSATLNDLSHQCYRHRLLAYFHNPVSQIDQALGEAAEMLREKAFGANRMVEKAPVPFESWFEVDVALAIAGRGYRVVPQYQFADKRIDLVVQGRKAQLAVECDGDFWHGAEEYTADMERQRKLERAGWHFVRIRESVYYASPEETMQSLWEELDRMNIRPIAEENGGNGEEENDQDFEPETDGDDGLTFSEYGGAGEEVETDADTDRASAQEGPAGIDEALRVRHDVLAKTIIDILQERPNGSCVRDRMPAYILKLWNIRTRGVPWQRFAKKVDDAIAVMARKGYITIYKSKNVRIKLGWENYPGM